MSKTDAIHCPYEGCNYHKDIGKTLKSESTLEKHIANVHEEKKFICSICSKKYAFTWQLDHHSLSCGQIWQCTSCGKEYKERLSLIQHAARHKHDIPEGVHRGNIHRHKSNILNGTNISPILPVNAGPAIIRPKILPKVTTSANAAMQTELSNDLSIATVNKPTDCQVSNVKPRKAQASTQTEKKKTSTSAQCHPVRTKRKKISPTVEYSQSTSSTQTLESVFSPSNCIPKTNSSTASTSVGTDDPLDFASQTSIPSMETLYLNRSTSTEEPLSGLNSDCGVQTDDLDTLLLSTYSTTETQTPNFDDWLTSVEVHNELDFSNCDLYDSVYDIETQTNWSIDGTTQTDWSGECPFSNLFNFND